MIRINLLGEEFHNQVEVYFWTICYGLSVLLVLFVCYMVQGSLNGSKEKLTTRQQALKLDLMKLRKTTKSVRTLKDKKDKLKNKISVVSELKKSKIGPVKMLDDLNVAIPANVWLREISEIAGSIKIKGRALDNTDITAFMCELAKSNYFSSIDLVESRQMFYSKSTGKVSPMPQIDSLKSEAFQQEQRTTKEDSDAKVKITSKNKELSEQNVKIKEFLMQASVSYAGRANSITKIEKEEAEQ